MPKFNNLNTALTWLYETQVLGTKLGLHNINILLKILKLPTNHQKTIHVAGTNGKGSICAIAESILLHENKKVGLFTSPHLINFTERIRLNGKDISPELLLKKINQVYEIITEFKKNNLDIDFAPTFFEITFAIAWWIFKEENVDVAIIEVGLGGRLDATNIIQSNVSVISTIANDHEHLLGNTLEKIALEKAHIIKKNIPSLYFNQDKVIDKTIKNYANKVKSPLKSFDVSHLNNKEFAEISKNLILLGLHQQKNLLLALEAVKIISSSQALKNLKTALKNVNWRGRFQKIGNDIILDGCHNLSSVKCLINNWQTEFPNQKAIIIYSSLKKKDFVSMLDELKQISDNFIFTAVNSSRALQSNEIIKKVNESQLFDTNIEIYQSNDLNQAIEFAKNLSDKINQKILICGSLFLVGEFLSIYENKIYEKSNQ